MDGCFVLFSPSADKSQSAVTNSVLTDRCVLFWDNYELFGNVVVKRRKNESYEPLASRREMFGYDSGRITAQSSGACAVNFWLTKSRSRLKKNVTWVKY